MKCDRLVSAANDKHQRALAEVQDEKQQVETKLKAMEEKVSGFVTSSCKVY